MSRILALETSAGPCSVALLNDEHIVQVVGDGPQRHTRELLPLVDQCLQQAGLRLTDLDAIAYCCGPGSFTGLRIGLSTAQGLAWGQALPLLPVSSLYATAAIQTAPRVGDWLCVANDARMSEFYWCLYVVTEQGCVALVEEQVTDAEALTRTLEEQLTAQNFSAQLWLLGTGWALPSLSHCWPSAPRLDQPLMAEHLIPLAEKSWKEGVRIAPEQSELVYLRNSVAWQKREKIRAQ